MRNFCCETEFLVLKTHSQNALISKTTIALKITSTHVFIEVNVNKRIHYFTHHRHHTFERSSSYKTLKFTR